MATSSELKDIADASMKELLMLTNLANEQERGSKIQNDLYEIKNKLYNTISKLWPLSASLRMEELIHNEEAT